LHCTRFLPWLSPRPIALLFYALFGTPYKIKWEEKYRKYNKKLYNLEGLCSTTKVNSKIEVCTTLIKVIYVISLVNVGLLTHTEQVETWNQQQRMVQLREVSTNGSRIDSDTILELSIGSNQTLQNRLVRWGMHCLLLINIYSNHLSINVAFLNSFMNWNE
jgi:hypothetical protein